MGKQPQGSHERRFAPTRCPITVSRGVQSGHESAAIALYFACIRNGPQRTAPQRDTGPRVNARIRAPELRLIGAEGENIGVVTPDKAMELAERAGLDLVEISPNATPPVCKIMDFGKFKYEQQKRESEARKKQKTIDVKEVKLRPGTDNHDIER